jgi:hypothetical protein
MRTIALSSVFAAAALALACSGEPLAPVTAEPALEAAYTTQPEEACWGQATKVFAMMGEMGEHSSTQPTPRFGLANLARALYDQGVIPEPTMAALGAFVADALGLSIDACM